MALKELGVLFERFSRGAYSVFVLKCGLGIRDLGFGSLEGFRL